MELGKRASQVMHTLFATWSRLRSEEKKTLINPWLRRSSAKKSRAGEWCPTRRPLHSSVGREHKTRRGLVNGELRPWRERNLGRSQLAAHGWDVSEQRGEGGGGGGGRGGGVVLELHWLTGKRDVELHQSLDPGGLFGQPLKCGEESFLEFNSGALRLFFSLLVQASFDFFPPQS